jgi:hypothetical protein
MKQANPNRAPVLAVVFAAVVFSTGAAVLPPTQDLSAPQRIASPQDDPVFSANLTTSNVAQLVAKAYGVEYANEIEAMAFSFNIQHGAASSRREWFWDVSENRIEYRGEGPTGLPINHTYFRDNLEKGDPLLNSRIDAQFVDDQYWLLFPFHLAWEKNLEVAYQPSRRMYIEPHESECVSVRYGEGTREGGDMYEIFIGPDRLIREWAYRPRGASEPAFITTWERYAKAGPMLFSLMHRSDDGVFRVWYDRVSVKLVDQGWVEAEPLETFLSRSPDSATPEAKKPF